MLRQLAILLAAMSFLLTPAVAYALGPYSVTDLGTLGGTSSAATALNDNGHVVGYSTLAGGETRAFFWTPGGGLQDLGALGPGNSQAFDVNNNDNVVGVTSDQAFRWTPGSGMVWIDITNIGSARGLNANNEAVGYRGFVNLPFESRLRTWTAADVAATPYLFSNIRGFAVNDLGQFVGTDPTSSIGMYGTGAIPFTFTGSFIPTDLNNNRLITGADIASGIATRVAAVLDFDTNTTIHLGKLNSSDASSNALGINQAGTIVGSSGASGAFITDTNLSLLSLTALLDPAFNGWTILSADDINNVGQIAGIGLYNGEQHAVLLTPVPEPSSLVSAVLAILSVFVFRRVRKSTP